MVVTETQTTGTDSATTQQGLNLALLEEAYDAFARDLPSLLETWPEYWVAYHGKERLGISYYPERLRRSFALPPHGRLSLRERWFRSSRVRCPIEDLTLYFIDRTALEDEFEITVDQECEVAEPQSDQSANGEFKQG